MNGSLIHNIMFSCFCLRFFDTERQKKGRAHCTPCLFELNMIPVYGDGQESPFIARCKHKFCSLLRTAGKPAAAQRLQQLRLFLRKAQYGGKL